MDPKYQHREQTCFLVTNLQATAVCFLVANFASNSSLIKMPTRSSQSDEGLINKCLVMLTPKIQSLVTKELEAQNKAQAEEIAVLKAEMAELKDSQQFISAQYEELITKYQVLVTSCKEQKNEIA